MKDIKAFEPIGGSWYIDGYLGGGAYGEVYSVYSDKTGVREYAAIKHIPIPASEKAYRSLQITLDTTDERVIGENLDANKNEVLSEYNIQRKYRGFTNFVDCQDIDIIKRGEDDLPGYDIFIRMEKLTNLANVTIGKRMEPLEVVKLGIDVCTALELLHKDGIVHRDLKPQNIFIGRNGDYKVGDFGTARSLPNGSTMMSYTGTSGFMAPEIANGEAAGYNADIYSLGIIMYSKLNGKAPLLPSNATSSVAQINQAEFDRLMGKPFPPVPGIPKELNRIVLKACTFKRTDRYQQASELKKELIHFLEGNAEPEETGEGLSPAQKSNNGHEGSAPIPVEIRQDKKETESTGQGNIDNSVDNSVGKTVHRTRDGERKTNEAVNEEKVIQTPNGQVSSDPQPESKRPKQKAFLWFVIAAMILVLITIGAYICFDNSDICKGNHQYTETVKRVATCISEGTSKLTCSVCGHTESIVIEKDGINHTGKTEVKNKKAATCGEDGYSGDAYCLACGKKVSAGKKINATGNHQWKEATYDAPKTCKVCGKTEGKPLTRAKVGEYITFGHYPQTSTGKDNTPIEWLVLDYDAKNNKALLISRYALDCMPYNTSYKNVTWETCTLRKWLNSTFLNNAFASEEKKAILKTTVDNSKGQGYYSTNGGNNTQDKVFLLSYAEAGKYFKNDNARKCAPTNYAKKQGAWTSSSYKVDGWATCMWWLRSPGSSSSSASNVYDGGARNRSSVNSVNDAVRPALWLDLSSDSWQLLN